MKIGLIGCGYIGKIHAKCIREVKNVDLIGVFDISKEAAEECAAQFSTVAYHDLDAFIAACDVVDIAAATTCHFELAKKTIAAGKHCFIEKPVTATVNEAEKLMRLAQKQKIKVQVGHVERYNPAYVSAAQYIMNPFFIEARRFCKFNNRGNDVSVVHDLMIHDIDLVLSFMKNKVIDIQAVGHKYRTETLDFANAKLTFANGGVAILAASRVAELPMRIMHIYQKNNFLNINFQEKKVGIVKFEKNNTFFQEISVIENNAIVEELSDFINVIQNSRIPKVTIVDGLTALHIADTIVNKTLQ